MKYYKPQKSNIRKRPGRVFYMRRRSGHILKPVLAILALFLCVYSLYYLLQRSQFFVVSHVRVFGAGAFVNGDDLVEIVKGQVKDKSIFKVDTKTISENLSQNFQGAKSIKVYKVFPKTVNIEVSERVPLALIYNDVSTDYYLIDEEGYILGIVDPTKTNLPKIYYEGDIYVGLFISKELVPVYLDLTAALSESRIKVSSLSFYPRHAVLFLEEGPEVLISNEKDKKSMTDILFDLLNQFKEKDKKVKKIDLRYDKVIVSYN
jgi:cell division septal protein FtsQ